MPKKKPDHLRTEEDIKNCERAKKCNLKNIDRKKEYDSWYKINIVKQRRLEKKIKQLEEYIEELEKL
jgi:hypothetical protein